MQSNKEIHYKYAIWILIGFVIVSLSVQWASIKDLSNLIGFALSFASLVLAGFAIVQALISGASLQQTIGTLRESAERTKTSADDIAAATGDLVAHVKVIPTALKGMTEKFEKNQQAWEEVAATLNSVAIPAAQLGDVGKNGDEVQAFLSSLTGGAVSALYCCLRSFETGKEFNPKDVYKTSKWIYYVGGYLTALAASTTMELTRTKESYSVTGLGILTAEAIRARIEEFAVKKSGVASARKWIDDFFDAAGSESKSSQ